MAQCVALDEVYVGGHNRFFVPPSAINKDTAALAGPVVHQIRNVLRLRAGDRITLLDNSGWQYEVEITDLNADELAGDVLAKSLVSTEPRAKITLYQGLLRGQQFEFVLQKASELGAAAIVPTFCQRCVIGNIGDAGPRKQARWERIVAEAAEQSRRGKIAALRPAMMLAQAVEQARGLSLLVWEDEDSLTLREVLAREARANEPQPARAGRAAAANPAGARLFSLNLFVGPEGGFAPEEVASARGYGIATVTLGPRLLRAETAAIVALALVLHELGDMDRSTLW